MNTTEIYTSEYLKFWHRQLSDKICWLFGKFDVYFETWEEDFFDTINNHEDIFNTDQIVTIFRDALVPLIIPLISILIAIFIIFVIPRCCYMHLCRKKRSINEFKHAWFFGVKIVLTIIIIALLFAFTTASIQSSMNLETALRNNIQNANNIVDELHNTKAKFVLQLHEVNNSIVTTLLSIRNMIDNIPQTLYDNLNIYIENDLNSARKSCDLLMSKKDLLFERSGLIIDDRNIQNILEMNLNIIRDFMETFTRNIEKINEKYEFEDIEDLNLLRNLTNNFRGHYHYPNWHLMYYNLQNTYLTLLPKLNESLDFMNKYPDSIKNYTQYEIEYIYNVTENFRNETEIIIQHLFDITRNVYHEDIRKNVRKLLTVTNNSLYAINRNSSFWGDAYLSSFLIIVPNIHSYICAISILLICIAIIYEIKCNGPNFVLVTKFRKCTILWMKMIILFALSLLWTGLVLAAICYTGALSLSMICRPIITDHLYTKYTDNIEVWDNKTWLDYLVDPWHHNYKLKDIVEKCSHNITVYEAFEVEKYWNVSNIFVHNEIIVSKQKLIDSIRSAIDSVEKPNGESCLLAKNKIHAVEKEITLLSPHIMYDVELIQNDDIRMHIERILKKYDKNIVELEENLNIWNSIAQLKVDNVLSNFMEFKYLLKTQQNELTNIQKMEQQIVDKLNENIDTNVNDIVNKYIETIYNSLDALEENLSYKVVNEMGNCYIYPKAIDMLKEKACTQMPQLLNMTWILLSFSTIFLLLSTFFSCQLCSALNEIRNERKIWLEKIEFDKLSNRRKRLLSGTLLFDRSGRFMGDSRTLLAQDAPEALVIHPTTHPNPLTMR